MKQFNRQAAAAYALKYSKEYNPEWPSFKSDGGDCSNFVSQALLAGGWTMITNLMWYGDSRAWYSEKKSEHRLGTSHTWTVAGDFAKFLTHSGRARKCQMNELALGDVVQLVKYDIVYHTMIVTGVLPDPISRKPIPFLTYHTNDVTQKPLTAIPTDRNTLYWKVNDWFNDQITNTIPIMPRAG